MIFCLFAALVLIVIWSWKYGSVTHRKNTKKLNSLIALLQHLVPLPNSAEMDLYMILILILSTAMVSNAAVQAAAVCCFQGAAFSSPLVVWRLMVWRQNQSSTLVYALARGTVHVSLRLWLASSKVELQCGLYLFTCNVAIRNLGDRLCLLLCPSCRHILLFLYANSSTGNGSAVCR